jgi:hypothetical protein
LSQDDDESGEDESDPVLSTEDMFEGVYTPPVGFTREQILSIPLDDENAVGFPARNKLQDKGGYKTIDEVRDGLQNDLLLGVVTQRTVNKISGFFEALDKHMM